MSADNNSTKNDDHSGELNTRVIVKSKKIGYFSKLFGKDFSCAVTRHS